MFHFAFGRAILLHKREDLSMSGMAKLVLKIAAIVAMVLLAYWALTITITLYGPSGR